MTKKRDKETPNKQPHPTDPDRWADGTLRAGHKKPGPGRKPAATEKAYLEAFKRSVPVGTFAKLVKQAVAHALKGDGTALKLLFQFALPQPTSRSLIELELATREFRCAGQSVAEIDDAMLARLRRLTAERRHGAAVPTPARSPPEVSPASIEPELSVSVHEPLKEEKDDGIKSNGSPRPEGGGNGCPYLPPFHDANGNGHK